MDKNIFINQITYEMGNILSQEQSQFLQALLTTKLINVDLVDKVLLPSTDCLDNETMIQNFMFEKISSAKEKSTILQYVRAVRRFLDFTNKNWIDCTKQDIINYLAYRLYKDNVSTSYRNTLLIYISQFFRWLYENEYIEKDITKGIQSTKTADKEIYYLSNDEIVRCRENLPKGRYENRYKALWCVMMECGFRVSEICDLKIEDFDFNKKEIRFWAEKTNRVNTTYITPELEFAIKKYIKDRKSGYIFTTRQNKRPRESTIENMAKAIGIAGNCDIKTTVHVFRKTFATSMRQKGMDLEQVGELLQHKDISTTNRFYVNKIANDTKHQRLKI